MANVLYPKGKEKLLSAGINMASDTIKVALVSSAYAYNAAHEFYASLSGVLGTPQRLANKSVSGGVFDADNVTFGTVAAGSTAAAVVIYKDTGDPATSPLIAYYNAISNFPFATDGDDIRIKWSDGANKIFAL